MRLVKTSMILAVLATSFSVNAGLSKAEIKNICTEYGYLTSERYAEYQMNVDPDYDASIGSNYWYDKGVAAYKDKSGNRVEAHRQVMELGIDIKELKDSNKSRCYLYQSDGEKAFKSGKSMYKAFGKVVFI